MATEKVVTLISKAQTLLQDTTSVRWSPTELQGWLNDAYREAVILRPDVNTVVAEYACAAGARQNLANTFPSAIRLIEVTRNTATTSNQRAIRLATRQTLDDQRRDWYTETPVDSVQLYAFDPRVPKQFLVYPPATAAARLEVIYSAVPAPHTLSSGDLTNPATTEVIRIDDSFANALVDYILYRAYTKDAAVSANAARAVAHYQAFQLALTGSAQANAASQPGAAK